LTIATPAVIALTAVPSFQKSSDPQILVVRDTMANSLHVSVTLAALEAGKHVISGKPLPGLAAHKNDPQNELSGREGSIRWEQERQNELWRGLKTGPTPSCPKSIAADAGSRRLWASSRRPPGKLGGRLPQCHRRHIRLRARP
jgi:predicted dehydrogenase